MKVYKKYVQGKNDKILLGIIGKHDNEKELISHIGKYAKKQGAIRELVRQTTIVSNDYFVRIIYLSDKIGKNSIEYDRLSNLFN